VFDSGGMPAGTGMLPIHTKSGGIADDRATQMWASHPLKEW
jgi:hypothetical protein